MKLIVIDAKDAVLGRLASFAAKQSLLGYNIVIVNCDDAIITGRPSSVIGEYKFSFTKGGANLQGPYFPRHPERIVKRTIRGMLAHRQGRGSDALKRIMCYNGTPEEFKESKKILAGKEKRSKTIKLRELTREL
ncbi:50S ribosomal protein L13 [Candidatus Pacearchaeota archaeon CG10_big_fil_rev_8_21_14_0_10_34_76]|nr:MAG: 50S ribosomal protein L13 [Candidatus Pacearchaeota archaeon CG10_big_fil_rev_8_21_14_0_10_34_76]